MNAPASVQSSYRGRLCDNIVPYEPADHAELAAFRAAMYGSEAQMAGRDHLRWLHEDNPVQRRTSIWLYKRDGVICGQQCTIPVRLSVGGVEQAAAWATEPMVHPAHRLRGVGAVMLDLCTKEQPLTLRLEASDAAAKAMRCQGWLDLGALPLFVRPLLPSRMLSQRLRSRGLKRAALLADLPIRVADAGVHMLLWRSAYRLRRVEAFDERLDRLFLRLSRRYPVMARRDRSVMHWRFLRHPDADRYTLYQLERGDELTGVLVTRLGLYNGVPVGHIVDYLCAPEHLRPLLARVLPVLRARGAAAVYCAQTWAGAARTFNSLGFLRRSTGFRMMMRVADDAALDVELLADRGSWFVTLGDANLERSRDGVVFA